MQRFGTGLAAFVTAVVAASPPVAASKEPLAGAGQALAGAVAGASAGYDLAAVGDLDGDGREELLVGAPFGDAGTGDSAGAAYLFYGPVDPAVAQLADADAVFLGGLPGDFTGEDLGAAGDLDGDGLDELLIGAPGSIAAVQPGTAAPGVAYLFHGRRERRRGTILLEPGCLGSGSCDATFTGVHDSDFFGFGIPNAPIGDTDGDGKDDLLIGSAGFGGFSGAAYLYYGRRFTGEFEATAADATFIGPAGGLATRPMTGAGDLDGDGLGDFAIAAPADAAGPTGPGSVHVYYGAKERRSGRSTMAAADAVLVGSRAGGRAGRGIAGGADVDRDGLSDLLVGEPGDTLALPAGRAHLIHGARERLSGTIALGSVAGQAVFESDTSDANGIGSAAALGDLDGDGYAEAVVGAPDTNGGAGAVAILRGGPSRRTGSVPPADADRLLVGADTESAGFSLAVGRSNGGMVGDLLVGVPGDETGGAGAGGARLVRGTCTAAACRAVARPAPPPAAAGTRPAPRLVVKAVRVRKGLLRVSGRVVRPAGTGTAACSGAVGIRLLAGRRTVARRRASVRPDCRFVSRIGVRGRRGARLVPVAAYTGNEFLRPARARGRAVRAR